ncbi:SH3 and PX domains 2A [Desmophyllum pertusum]|uniref:SH3 and PX domains 2A n=1 Tax=Desmophyllum pertusum TaxID=174260 RepID=A0A9W9YCS6_9CNID|nr:SH3 and PX domains 2A [Desmophyllum pertusum]
MVLVLPFRAMSLTQVQDVSVQDICKRNKPRKHYVYFIHVHWQNGPITPIYRSYSTLIKLQERLLRIEDFLVNQKDEANTGTLLKGKSFSDRFTIKKRAKALKRMPVVEEFLKSVVHRPPHISGSDPVINFFHPLPEDLIELDYEQAQIYNNMEKQGTKSKYIHHISEPILLEQYVAISDYTKREESDINLKAGNVVDVIEKNEHGWWFVDLDSELGWVPASYLEPRDGSLDDQVLEIFEEGEGRMK